MVAQVGDPRAIAVAGAQMHTIRCGKHLLQVALAVRKRLPQVQIDAALVGRHLGQLLVHPAQHIGGKARLFRCHGGPHRRDGLHVNGAAIAQRLAQQVQHLAVVGKEAV